MRLWLNCVLCEKSQNAVRKFEIAAAYNQSKEKSDDVYVIANCQIDLSHTCTCLIFFIVFSIFISTP